MGAHCIGKIMKQINIELPKETYLSGEVVKGTVNFSIEKPVKARSLNIKVTGLERTRIVVERTITLGWQI